VQIKTAKLEELAGHMASISALELHQKVAEKQAAITNPDEAKNPGRRVRESFVKLFTTSTMGFDLRHKDKEGKDDSSSARDSSDQSNFSKQSLLRIIRTIGKGGCGIQFLAAGSMDKAASHTAHLYPWRAGTSMDTIFGAGSSKELFSWRNGLVLHKVVETALDKGVIAIVPSATESQVRENKTAEKRHGGKGAGRSSEAERGMYQASGRNQLGGQ